MTKHVLSVALGCLLAAPVFGADSNGLKPRKNAGDYAAQAGQNGAVLAGSLLSPDEVKKLFSTDLNRGYAVVEVAFYPKDGQTLDVSADDFVLRVAGTQTTARPARPRTIVAILQKDSTKGGGGGRNVDLYPTATIGYESGGGYDPMTGGRQRTHGVYTGAGVGVGVGGSDTGPASTPADRRTMEMELTDQSLPEGPTGKAVAGYLYFPLPTKKKSVLYDLEYSAKGTELTLELKPKK